MSKYVHLKYPPKAPITQIDDLKKIAKFLSRIPPDFRDIIPGSEDWQGLDQYGGTDVRKHMWTWLHGPVLYAAPITEFEFKYFEAQAKGEIYAIVDPNTQEDIDKDEICESLPALIEWLEFANEENYSWFYVKGFNIGLVQAINKLCSQYNYTVRLHVELTNNKGEKYKLEDEGKR